MTETSFDPASLGLPRATLDDLRGGNPAHNAAVARAVLAGQAGPVRDIVLLNAAAAIAAAEGLGAVAAARTADPAATAAATGEALAKTLSEGLGPRRRRHRLGRRERVARPLGRHEYPPPRSPVTRARRRSPLPRARPLPRSREPVPNPTATPARA